MVDLSGQPAEFREKDPFRFIYMASLAFGGESVEACFSNKKILDVGCGGGHVSKVLLQYASGLWLCDPEINHPNSPVKNSFDPRFLLPVKAQDAVRIVPELQNLFDVVTSFAPHPYALNLPELNDEIYQGSADYYASMVSMCRPGGDMMVMPVYERDLGLKDGIKELYALMKKAFAHVDMCVVSLADSHPEFPFFSVFVWGKNKLAVASN